MLSVGDTALHLYRCIPVYMSVFVCVHMRMHVSVCVCFVRVFMSMLKFFSISS